VIRGARPTEIDSQPESQVRNSQPHGIGRVAALNRFGAWSNLGRNVVFVGPDRRARAIFDESVFSDDESSQYDLDIHAILDLPDQRLVLTVNHFGTVRAFDSDEVAAPGPLRRVSPIWMREFAVDVERYVVVNARLVGSAQREQRSPGLLISEPLRRDAMGGSLELGGTLESWGTVTAVASLDAGRVAVGGNAHVGVAAIDNAGSAVPLWDVSVDFDPAALLWDGHYVWAAGSEAGPVVDDYDWEARRGGGFAALDPASGRAIVRGCFDQDLAWGTGGVAITVVPGFVCGFGRRGEVHLFDARDGHWVGATERVSDASLGIAHGARLGDHLVYGFNRGGYRLWTLPVPVRSHTA
jgi:hypothetical protein